MTDLVLRVLLLPSILLLSRGSSFFFVLLLGFDRLLPVELVYSCLGKRQGYSQLTRGALFVSVVVARREKNFWLDTVTGETRRFASQIELLDSYLFNMVDVFSLVFSWKNSGDKLTGVLGGYLFNVEIGFRARVLSLFSVVILRTKISVMGSDFFGEQWFAKKEKFLLR
ncbi:hypothetical protein Tco_0763155 [Tanacetum coccineum]